MIRSPLITWKELKVLLVTAVLFVFGTTLLYADDTVLVSQQVITGEADYGSGAGQSFLLPANVTVHGIQLHIGSRAGSVRVDLWRTRRSMGNLERVGLAPLTSATLLKSSVDGNTPGWFTMIFDTPIENSGPHTMELVFDFALLTSGSAGFNNYSFSNEDSYQEGARVYWSSFQSKYSESSSVDLTFRILGSIGPPRIDISVAPASTGQLASVTIMVPNSIRDISYTCYESENVGVPKQTWDVLGTQLGTGRVIEWKIEYGSMPLKRFFFVEAVEN
ncbi:MAG: hypothetical protein AAGD22_11955 [Verrucomicrobiota bacterium]